MSSEENGDKTGAEAEFVAARIERLLREAFVTENGALRPAKPSDIVILMRSPGMIAGVYQAALQKRGIACDVGAGGDLMQTAEIEILFQLLQIIDNPHRDIPLAAAMASPVFAFSPEELALLRARRSNTQISMTVYVPAGNRMKSCARFYPGFPACARRAAERRCRNF